MSVGNYRLSKEVYGTFLNDIKKRFLSEVKKAYEIQQLSSSKTQVAIRLAENKLKDKRFIIKFGPFYLLFVVTEFISKGFF